MTNAANLARNMLAQELRLNADDMALKRRWIAVSDEPALKARHQDGIKRGLILHLSHLPSVTGFKK
ncbi:hypothetical protein [Yersinia intermedia]|uniref:hypothetical protein n=1 Tax=Yersinia intermedia TaxID=631 RepID=UPI00067AED34|nr:hypothetical protein [Yersinia intermedia]